MEGNPIYKYLKENSLTDLSEADFVNKYTDRNNLKEVYDYLKTEGQTDLDFTVFSDKYFPKSTEVSPQGSAGTSAESVEPTQNTDTSAVQPGEISPQQNVGSSDQSSGGSISGDQFLSALNNRNRQIAGATGLSEVEPQPFELTIPEGSEIVPNMVNEYGLPVYANRGEEGYTGGGSVLPPIDLRPANRQQAEQQNQRIEREDKGFWADLGNSLQAGLTDLNAGLSAVPEFLYRLGAVPQNLLADAIENNAGEGTADWLRARYENVSNGVYNPLRILSDYSKSQQEQSEAYAQEVTQFNDDIIGSIGNGNFLDAGRQIANSIVQSAPSMVGLIASSGVGSAANLGNISRTVVNAIPFAAGAYQDIEENTNMSENQKLIASSLKGLSEVIFEQEFGTAALVESIIGKSIGKEATKDIIEGYMGRVLNSNGIPASAFKGSISEGATTLSQNIIEKYSGENPEKDLWEGVADAMIVGGVMDSGISGLSSISDRINDPSKKSEAQEIEQQISSLKNDLNNVDGAQSGIIQQTLESKTDQLNNLIEEDSAEYQVTPEQQQQLDSLSERESLINGMIADESISEATKNAMQSELTSIQEQRDLILNQKNEETESTVSTTETVVEDTDIPSIPKEVSTETISSATSGQGVYYRDGERGEVRVDGQTVVFETDNTIYELGNVDEVSERSISEFDIEAESPLDINVDEDYSVTIDGTRYVNQNSDPMAAINYSPEGEVVSVNMDTEDGSKRTIRGQRAQEVAYQYTLRNFEQNATEQQIDSAIEQANEAVTAIDTVTETVPSTTVENIDQPTKPRVQVEAPADIVEVVQATEVIPQTETQTNINEETETPTETAIEENVAESIPTEVVPESESSPTQQAEPTVVPERPVAPKGALKAVSDKLAKTGLAKSVKVENSEAISKSTGRDGASINGYVDQDGNIAINSDKASLDTPIHEFSHIWEREVEKSNPEMHNQGITLVSGPDGAPYVDHVRRTQPSLEGAELYKEALAQAIGDRGARLLESQKNGPLKEWLKKAWEYIGGLVGISNLTSAEIANLTLDQYADAVATDLLQGKPIAKLDNGDIIMATEATSVSAMTKEDKFMADFIERMKMKNGKNFQGNVDGSLSAEDFTDLVTFFRYGKDNGQIKGIDDARLMAKSMGIQSPAEVDMAYKLSELQAKESTGFKKSEVSPDTLKNAQYDKMSDNEYRNVGKRLVDEGLIDPKSLVADIIENPRALQPWEVAALQYYRSTIESEISTLADMVDTNNVDSFTYKMGDETLSGYKAVAVRMEDINRALFDLEVTMLTTASQQSAAFRMRSMMSDKDFNVVQYLAEMKARGFVDEATEKKLKDLSAELNVVRAKLKNKMSEVDRLTEQIAQGNINYEAQRPKKRSKVRPKKDVIQAVNIALDSIDYSSFGLSNMSFQTNGVLRFQTNSSDALSQAVSDAVSSMRDNISKGTMSIADAIESAISDINSAVGQGNWDETKFRSTIANNLVQQSVPVKVKKPYVNTNGKLIIPGEYIKDIASQGNDTIEKMVSKVSSDLGGRFSDYDIRNSISGYGRQSARNKTDLERSISKARRVANLLSQIEDLETKGKRLRTRKQVYNNDLEIENLKRQVKQLEYDFEMTPEEREQLAEQRYNDTRQKYIRNYIDQMQQRISDKDFASKTHKNKYEEDSETKRLRAEAEKIKNEFKAEKYRHELESRSIREKIGSLMYDLVFNITRGLSAGMDASAIGVQALIYSAARPVQALRTLWDSRKGSFSEAEYEKYFSELQSDPLYEVARKAKLNLQLPNFYQSVQEEQFKGSIPAYLMDFVLEGGGWVVGKATGKDVESAKEFAKDKLNPARVADRNYSLVLSKVRMDLFREFIHNQINKRGLDVELDAKEVERVAEVVNTITMASKVPGVDGKVANDIVSTIMFSARKFVATWKVLGGWIPLAINNRTLLYDAYGGIIGKGLGTLLTAAALPSLVGLLMQDEDDEDPYFLNKDFLNPIHSDFLKIRLGNTRISLFNGIDGNIVFANRLFRGEYMTSSSQAVKVLGGKSNNKTRGELMWEYISNKFAPTTSIATNYFLYSDREKQESYDRFKESFAPMWATGLYEQYQSTENIPESIALGAAGFFGLAYNNYGGAEFAKGTGTENKKVREIFDKSGLSVYDPGEGTRDYFNGNNEVPVTGKEYKDKYLPLYKDFMTEAVLTNESNLSESKNWEYKEGLINNIKKEAYKHAELEISGIILDETFKNITYDSQAYVIPKSLYYTKKKYIEEYMSENKSDISDYAEMVEEQLRESGLKPTKKYVQMLAKNELYKEAKKQSNTRLIEDFESGKVKLIPKNEFMKSEDKYEDE